MEAEITALDIGIGRDRGPLLAPDQAGLIGVLQGIVEPGHHHP